MFGRPAGSDCLASAGAPSAAPNCRRVISIAMLVFYARFQVRVGFPAGIRPRSAPMVLDSAR